MVMIGEDVSELIRALPERISDLVEPWVHRCPDRPALVDSSGTWTYKELFAAISQTEAWLEGLGIRPGDRVMIVCENCRPFVAILLACARLDAWPVLVNARLSAREVDEIRDHCGARRVLYTTQVSAQARELAKRHGAVVSTVSTLGSIGVAPLNESVQPEPLESSLSDRVAALIYTSGTTGKPKGVMLTHRNLLFVAAVSARIRSLTGEDRLYGILPMSHAVGLSVILLGTLHSGATCYLSALFDPVAALSVLDKQKLTIFLGAPATFALVVEYCKLKGIRSLKFPALRAISCSGAPLQAGLKAEVEALFGVVLHHGFGVTECSPNILQTRIEAPREDISVGTVIPGVEVKLVAQDGQHVADGEPGELLVRGPNIMKGYYRAPAETAAAIDSEGWFNTRDLARAQDGNFFIVGRTKELIVRFGFNVYPAEVEAVLNNHPGVVRSAVVGRTLEQDGNEEIIAFVQSRSDGSLTPTEVAQHAAKYLAPYKQPSQIFILPSLPLTPTGKVAKEELKKILMAQPQ
jgi:acyl-CoA synthetase (AMP-forming)/AMP-acid ligase II